MSSFILVIFFFNLSVSFLLQKKCDLDSVTKSLRVHRLWLGALFLFQRVEPTRSVNGFFPSLLGMLLLYVKRLFLTDRLV